MSTVDISREHDLSVADCNEALNQLASYLRGHFGASVNESEGQLDFDGKGFSGRVVIVPGVASGTIKLGLLARPFKRQLESEINRQLDARLGVQ